MNGHDKRRQQITERIKRTALELFTKYSAQQVSMDQIAAAAQVSKVTIYKYFLEKENLYREVTDLYIEQVLASTEKMIDSDLDFSEKLKFTLLAKQDSPRLAEGQSLFDLLDRYGGDGDGRQAALRERIQRIMFKFFEQGKKEGYIEPDLPFELLFLYTEIFDAGVKAKAVEVQALLSDPQAFEQLMRVFYFGVFRKIK